MSEWRFVGAYPGLLRVPVPDSETISIGGVNPWRYQWTTLRHGVPIILPDPVSSSRAHWLTVYEIKKDDLHLTFATGQIEDRIWGFYVPAAPGDAGASVAREPEYEGYWRSTIDERSDLPWPTPDPEWTGRDVFLRLLDGVETHAERIAYRGLSVCRVCSCHNGYEGLRLGGWEWPAGYRHYIADHGVGPSLAFENHILTLTTDLASR
jgi:hypothetical protein